VDDSLVDEAALRSLGARGVVRPSRNLVQVVIGPQAEIVAGEIREAMATGESSTTKSAAQKLTRSGSRAPGAVTNIPFPMGAEDAAVADNLVSAFGGPSNVMSATHVAVSRLRIELRDDAKADEGALKRAGVNGVAKAADNVWHVIAGQRAPAIAAAIKPTLNNQ
jgi:PTS system N-acetylglucosamine-specific IIC component